MATDTYLLERLRRVLQARKVTWKEQRMFGGDCFMVDEKMCFGTFKGGLLARVDPEKSEQFLKKPGTGLMEMGGKTMKGFIHIEPVGCDTDDDLEFWIDECLAYNPKAKSSKKK